MKKSWYMFNPGRLSRKDNTLYFYPKNEAGEEGQPRPLPIETVEDLFVFGSLDVNSALLVFLGQHHVPVHFFNFYEHYSGSFMPRDYLLAGKVQVEQTLCYHQKTRRQMVARRILEGASFNMLKVLRYYENRGEAGLSTILESIENYSSSLLDVTSVSELMGLEGNIRQTYYAGFDLVLKDFEMGGRSKRPPKNEVNALVSLGNMMCYGHCLKQIYHTQLNPTISFLHEPGARRFSLALDLAEIFKPILVDRLVFSMLNKREIQADDFRHEAGGCFLKPAAAQRFARSFDEKLNETILHRTLKRHVSYKRLIRLECYKLIKHVLGDLEYKPFKIWW